NERARAAHRLKIAFAHQLLIRLGDRSAGDAEGGRRVPRRGHALAARETAAHDCPAPELIELPRQRQGRIAIDPHDEGHKWPIRIGSKWLMSAWATLSTMTLA